MFNNGIRWMGVTSASVGTKQHDFWLRSSQTVAFKAACSNMGLGINNQSNSISLKRERAKCKLQQRTPQKHTRSDDNTTHTNKHYRAVDDNNTSPDKRARIDISPLI